MPTIGISRDALENNLYKKIESFLNEAKKKNCLTEYKDMSPLVYNQSTRQYEVNPKMDCFEQLQKAIAIITPYLQTNSQIRNMRFLSVFNEMFLLLKKISSNKIITEDDKVIIGKLINQVEKLILH